MTIEHLAIWTANLETMKQFYSQYFGTTSTEKYVNTKTNFESYFLSFANGCRIELMHQPAMSQILANPIIKNMGLSHFAISVGSIEKVNQLTEQLRTEGYRIIGEPRTTGDGYYESVILDPEHNQVEITI
jgi:lactoylglutathione lyase